jgi:hypothetical protein
MDRTEQTYGAAMTYTAAAMNAGVGHWMGENWFLILSAIAVLIRIGIDLSKLIQAWRNRRG